MVSWVEGLVEGRALKDQVYNALDQCGSNDNYITVVGMADYNSIGGKIKAYFESQRSQMQLQRRFLFLDAQGILN